MNVPRPNLAIFDAHPPVPCGKDGKPIRATRAKARPRKRNVTSATSKRPPRGGMFDRANRMREQVEALKLRPGEWHCVGDIPLMSRISMAWHRRGCETRHEPISESVKRLFVRWPEGKP